MQVRVVREASGRLTLHVDGPGDCPVAPGRFLGSDELLHTYLCAAGYKRVLKYGVDALAGLYLRQAVMA